MTDRLRRLLEAQREFVADASHQLRTPLAGLRLRLEEALAAGAPVRTRTQIVGALGEVDRLAAIVSDLLSLSHATDARTDEEQVPLADAARAAARRWVPAAQAHGATVRAITPAAETDVRCSRADLDRILDALIENALAYGPEDGAVQLVAQDTRIEVRDEGPGPAPGEEDAVFARFHRGSSGRAGSQGTGLGLSIARELAARWDARVSLGRGPAGGGVAIVAFPEGPR
jgi:signal transduction histidine kinase